MSFKDEILKHFMDEELLVSVDRDPTRWSSGNGSLYTGLFYVCLALQGKATLEDLVRFKRAIDPLWVTNSGITLLGLLERNDIRPDLEAHDNYIGVAAASYFLNSDHASHIVTYGRANSWCFDNTNPRKFSLRSWHGRFPGLVGFYRMCARQSPGMCQAALLSLNILRNAYSSPKESSGKILTWLMIQVTKAQAQANCTDAIEIWESRLRKDYGHLGNLFAAHFGSDHPFATYS